MEANEIQIFLINENPSVYSYLSVICKDGSIIVGFFGAISSNSVKDNLWKFTKTKNGREEILLDGFDILKIEN